MTRLTYGALTPEQSLLNFDVVAEDADFDGALDVDGADFLSWQRGNGDANGSGTTDAVDLGIWQSQYGAGSSSAAAAAVPEPSSLLLLLTGLLGVRRRNR